MTENSFLNTIPLITVDTLPIITFLIALFLFPECKIVFPFLYTSTQNITERWKNLHQLWIIKNFKRIRHPVETCSLLSVKWQIYSSAQFPEVISVFVWEREIVETYPSEVPQVRLSSVLRSRSMLGSRSWGNSSSSLSSSSCLLSFSSSSADTCGSALTESVWTDPFSAVADFSLSVCTAAWETQQK